MHRRFTAVLLMLAAGGAAAEFSGNVALEAQLFAESPRFDGQFDENLTASFEPRWECAWNDGDELWSFELFLRADPRDDGREHADVREALWLRVDGDNEWRVGINTLFWGVVESKHLVDVVNQVDAVEGIDGEEKLGQPMLHLKHYLERGVIDLLLLPGFRERTFPQKEGRPRAPLVVDTERAEYESSDEDRHVDYALRYSRIWGDLDFGVSWFDGTSREPLLLPGADRNGNPILVPFYEQMRQLGVDAQLIHEDWIYRLEAIRREADSNDFNAATAGFEYTFYGILDAAVDLGLLLEYSWDERDKIDADALDDDFFLGARFAFNDEQSSEILAGLFVDRDNRSRSFRVEGNRRFGASWKGTLELQTFNNVDSADPLAAFSSDDYLLLEMAYYF